MTARLRIECSTTELLWRDDAKKQKHQTRRPIYPRSGHRSLPLHALARTRTAMPFSTSTSSLRVYQFHHEGGHENCLFRTNISGCHAVPKRQTDLVRAGPVPAHSYALLPSIYIRGRRGSNP